MTYCNGYRGIIGADELVKKGFKATTIEGGYAAWQENQKNEEKDSPPFSDVKRLLAEHGFEIVSQHEKPPQGKVFNFTKLLIIAKKAS